MKLAAVHDAVFVLKNGAVYCNKIDYNMLKDFKRCFDEIEVIGRKGEPCSDFVMLDIQGVRVRTIESVVSGTGILKHFELKKNIYDVVSGCDAVYCRGFNGVLAQKASAKYQIKNMVFVGGCVYDSLRTSGSFFKKIAAGIVYKIVKKSVYNSDVVLYCSEHLKEKYPLNGISFVWTEVDLPQITDDMRHVRHDKIDRMDKEIVLGLIGQVNTRIKGIDTAIKALGLLDNRFKLKILGSGDYRIWDQYLSDYKVKDRVEFCGVIRGGIKVLKWLDTIDIYIQPSRTEGLPKASLEAMNRGCPVIASDAGGLPGVVNSNFIHEVDDYKTLAELIYNLACDKNRMHDVSEYSFNTASRFDKKSLDNILLEACAVLTSERGI